MPLVAFFVWPQPWLVLRTWRPPSFLSVSCLSTSRKKEKGLRRDNPNRKPRCLHRHHCSCDGSHYLMKRGEGIEIFGRGKRVREIGRIRRPRFHEFKSKIRNFKSEGGIPLGFKILNFGFELLELCTFEIFDFPIPRSRTAIIALTASSLSL